MAQGAYVRERFALYAWMFFVAWLAAQDWPRKISAAIAVVVCALAIASAAARISAQQSWKRELREYTSVRQYIEPPSTILANQRGKQYPANDPMADAVAIMALERSVDLQG